jgi:hypothetical protein
VLDSHNSNLDWDPTASDSQSLLTVSGSSFNSAGENAGEGDAGISLTAGDGSKAKLLVVDGEISSNAADGVRATGGDGSVTRVQVSGGATVSDNGQTGVELAASGTADARYFLNGLDLQHNGSHAISLTGTGGPTVDATVSSNGIGTSTVAGSGSVSGAGVFAELDDETDGALAISQNIVKETAAGGIAVRSTDPGGSAPADVDVTIVDNTVGPAGSAADAHGIDVLAGGDNDLCLDISGNDADGVGSTAGLFEDIAVHQLETSTFSLERFTGDGAHDPDVESFLLAQNPASDSASATHSNTFTGVDDGACESPALP